MYDELNSSVTAAITITLFNQLQDWVTQQKE